MTHKTRTMLMPAGLLFAGLLSAGSAQAGLIATDAGMGSTYTTNNNNDLGLPGGKSQTVLVGYQLGAETFGALSYEYLGKEAGYTNTVYFDISINNCTFSTATSVKGQTCSSWTPGGPLAFTFTTSGGGTSQSISNGDVFSVNSAMTFGLKQIDAFSWYILLDDSGGNPNDKDFDDLGLKVVFTPHAVPEPGTLALLGLGMAGLGAMRRRRKAT
jgi:hypothetical protein